MAGNGEKGSEKPVLEDPSDTDHELSRAKSAPATGSDDWEQQKGLDGTALMIYYSGSALLIS